VAKTKTPSTVCPVTNAHVEINTSTMMLPLRGSQRIYFASIAAAKRFYDTPVCIASVFLFLLCEV
jgi:hypothetical protein